MFANLPTVNGPYKLLIGLKLSLSVDHCGMARVKLRCIMGCPGLERSYREKGLLSMIVSNDFPFVLGLKSLFSMLHSFFYKKNFIRTKALVLVKKIKNKLRIRLGLLSRRT